MSDAAVDWSEANIAILENGVRDGLSYSQIAKLIPNCSKMAALGKAWRMGLRPLPKPSPPARAPKVPRVRRAPHRNNGLSLSRLKKPKVAVQFGNAQPSEPKAPFHDVRDRAFEPLPGVAPISFLARTRGQCRWPVGGDGADMLVCGAACQGNYCPTHDELSQPPRGSRQRLDEKLGIPTGGAA